MAYSIKKEEVITYPVEDMEKFYVYGYEWIDNLHFAHAPEEFLKDASIYVEKAKKLFLEAGWEGDGDVELVWLPPFVFPLKAAIPPVGVVLWHVKQDNDGVSFIISPIELPFEEFSFEQ